MKDLTHLDPYRMPLLGDMGDSQNGAFKLKIKGETYTVIASNGHGWEHVSIAHKHKTPSWATMCELKDLFFDEEETVIQYHPPKSQYINIHKNCLHLWKPTRGSIPAPPHWMVGTK